MPIIKPTVGRKLWYRPDAHDTAGIGGMSVAHGQPLDATVLAVWGDRCVNLKVRDVCGKSFVKTSCLLVQEGDELVRLKDGTVAGGYAEWMPYQLGQAKNAGQAIDPSRIVQPGDPQPATA